MVDVLEYSGSECTEDELYARLNPHKDPEDRKRWRPRDLRRRVLLPLLRSGVVEARDVPGCARTWSLASDWLEALNRERERAGEIEAQRRDTKRYERERDGYREELERRKRGPLDDYHPANVGADGWVGDLNPLSHRSVGDGCAEASVSGLAGALKGYLELNPGDACQRWSWLGLYLWSEDLVIGKPTAREVAAAIEELGGEVYLRSLLERVA